MSIAAPRPPQQIKPETPEGTRRGTDIRVGQLIKRSPVVVRPDVSIEAALKLMAHRAVGSVIVIDEPRAAPVGILTLQDVLLRIALPRTDLSLSVASVMSRDVVCVHDSVSVHQVALQMARNNLHHLPVIGADGGLLGLISRTDIYDLLCESCVAVRRARKDGAVTKPE